MVHLLFECDEFPQDQLDSLDPNNLSPLPTFADILISNAFKASAVA